LLEIFRFLGYPTFWAKEGIGVWWVTEPSTTPQDLPFAYVSALKLVNIPVSISYMHLEAILFIFSIAQVHGDFVTPT
jgi:hypothetical protein